MDDKPYVIEFPDGTKLDRITLNSTTWVSYVKLPVGIFRGVHEQVTASNGETSRVYSMAVVNNIDSPNEGEFWFNIQELDPVTVQITKMAADIEYLAMMMGEDL